MYFIQLIDFISSKKYEINKMFQIAMSHKYITHILSLSINYEL